MTNNELTLETFERNPEPIAAAIALKRDGAIIINNQASTETVAGVASELRAHFDSEGHYAESDFNGYSTLRTSAILAKSRTSAELIGDKAMFRVIDEVLLQFCEAYQVGSTTGIEILPGETAQILHRDDSIYPMSITGVEWQLSIMWALNDFTVENGATCVVPGSHQWHAERRPKPHEILQMDMDAGGALIYLGKTLHGGGENRSDHPRMGLVNTYSLGWLRQEVNQYLTIPRDVMATFPDHVQRVMGYQAHGDFLGKYPQDPDGGWYKD
jgi:ectoine hydroxylase-related dioxygenase (phytanoyl-CoA dioxygenase family)